MKPISLNLPNGAVAIGEILRDYSESPRRLSEDILQVALPTGLTIDVGWSPRFDPTGRFVIVVFGKDWDDQIISPMEVASPSETARIVERLAAQYSSQVTPRALARQ